jgi:DNA-binding NarL/FixJ family response regulator
MADKALDGQGLIRQITEERKSARVVALAEEDDPTLVAATFAAGAGVYVLKRAHAHEILAVVGQLFENTIYLRPPEPDTVVTMASAEREEAALTRREREILSLVATGLSNGDAARALWVTEQTIKYHLTNIYRKLRVSNRTAASSWAYRHGLVPAEQTTVVPAGKRLSLSA